MKAFQGLSIREQRLKHDFKYYVDSRLFIPYTDKKYIITEKHLESIKGVMDNAFTLIEAYRSFGKCMAGDTIVSTLDGPKMLKDVSIGDALFSLDGLSLKETKVIAKVNTGIKKGFKITGVNGASFIASEDHRVNTFNGFKKVKELTTDDYLIYPILLDYATANVSFVKIKEIKEVGNIEMYDIEVDKYKNFIANGFSVHNSELITYAFALWRAEMWNEDVLILSANEPLAHLKLDLIRNSIETDNPELRYMYSGDMANFTWNRGEIHLIDRNKPVYSDVIDHRTGQQKSVANYSVKAKIHAKSMFSALRGLHVPNILCDDVVVEQNSASFDLIQKTKSIFLEAIVPIRTPESRMVVVGTPQNDHDLLASLKKNLLWKKIIIPVWDEKEVLSCPDLHTKEFISQQRILLGESSFQKEYLLKPTNEIVTDFTWEILNKSRNFDTKFESWYEKKPHEKIFIGTDYSVKDSKEEAERKKTDYFVLIAIAFDPETRKRRILAMHRERGIKFSDQISMSISWYHRYQADALCTESHAFLNIFNQVIGDIAKDIVIEDTGTQSGKFDKIKGIPSMKWEWERGLWEVPCGDELSLSYANLLFSELNQLENSRYDDLADALFRANIACNSITSSGALKYTPRQARVEESLQNNLLNLGRVW